MDVQGSNPFPTFQPVGGTSRLLLQPTQGSFPRTSLPSGPQQKVGTLPGQRRTLLDTIAKMPGISKQDMIFVVLHAKRSSSKEPWGMAFSMFDDRIVIGKVKDNGKHVMKWCHSIRARSCLLDASVVFSPMLWSWDTPGTYSQRLQAYAAARASSDALHQQLWPGDLLLSMDGYDPVHFQSLTGFTNYLRKVNQFTLVVLRHPHAATSAMKFWDPRMYNGMPPPPEAAFRAATAADFAWKQITCPSSTTMAINSLLASQLSTIQSSIVRQVTPDQQAPATNSPVMQATPFGAPRTLFGPVGHGQFANPLDLLCQVAESSNGSNNSFHAARQASTAYLKQLQSTGKATHKVSSVAATKLQIPSSWRNPWFKDQEGNHLPYEDNLEFTPEDGQRADMFISPIDSFPTWLAARKQTWRRKYKPYLVDYSEISEEDEKHSEVRTVNHDFWSPQGFASFDDWMAASLKKWKPSYSWNKSKKQRIQQECDEVVHVSQDLSEFQHWLRIRRNQWRILRRKRQREKLEVKGSITSEVVPTGVATLPDRNEERMDDDLGHRKRRKHFAPVLKDLDAIDEILEREEEERRRRESEKRRLLDLSFLFDASLGAPDDVVVHCFSFLESKEYSKLLCLNKAYATALKAREEVWKRLCPSHWILPRRPRKPWHELYFHRLRIEQRDSQKLWDDLLLKCSTVLFKGDHLQTIEKLVQQGEKDFGFHVNYVSPVVCERNSILNLAVIHQRHKVVRWLVEQKQADIESYDRGHFTALLNAAWAGDRHLVRYFLRRGADRSKIGYGHYTTALAHPDFKGLTAEGWARRKGHDDIANLIRLGL